MHVWVCKNCTWSTGQPPPRSMAVQGGEGGGIFWPPVMSPVTITVPFMGTLAAEKTATVRTPWKTPHLHKHTDQMPPKSVFF